MRVRHKIPSIFSLSMVDVLCCALGCVILLWLLGAKQGQDESIVRRTETDALRRQIASEREQGQRLLAAEREQRQRGQQQLASSLLRGNELDAKLMQVLSERDRAVALGARLSERIRDLEEVRDGLKSDLAGLRLRAGALETKLKDSLARVSRLEADVKSGADRLDAERRRSAGAEASLKALRADLDRARARHDLERRGADELRRTIDARERDLAAANRGLLEAREARGKLEKALAAKDRELEAARSYKERWEAAEERERFLARQLKDRQAAMLEASKTLKSLKRRTATLKAASESRFAGIALTGKRVVFLVDMSGSMELLDESTKAPHKWVEVRNTVARLMRSLPGLEKFQVITFNNKIDFPLGGDEEWLAYRGEASVKQVLNVLEKVKPDGGTNMYTALEAAFRYRKAGLDTVYLLSDGLPNLGQGLTPTQKKNLSELERGVALGKYIRARLKRDWNRRAEGKERVRIHTIGFFYESPDLGSFLWALARENDGSFVGMSKP
jgi:hypothetical protein